MSLKEVSQPFYKSEVILLHVLRHAHLVPWSRFQVQKMAQSGRLYICEYEAKEPVGCPPTASQGAGLRWSAVKHSFRNLECDVNHNKQRARNIDVRSSTS